MRGCWWPCMESTPRKGKTFLNRARATSSISCSKVWLTTWDDLIAPCRQRGAARAVHQQWGAEVLQQGEEEQEEESRDRICRVRAGGGLPQNWIKPASGLFEFELLVKPDVWSALLCIFRNQLISTQALKHQLPLGMLQGIEDRLDDTFSANPNTEYVVEDLSRW